MKLHKSVLMLSLCFGLTTPGFAKTGDWELSLAPGYAAPVGGTSDYLKGSASLDGSVFYSIQEAIAAGLELGYIFSSKLEGVAPGRIVGDVDGDGKSDPLSFTSDIHLSVLHITPEIKLGHELQSGNLTVKPYLIGGGGYYLTHVSAGTLTLTGATSSGFNLNGAQGTADSSDDKNGGFNIGGGMDALVGTNLRLGLDVRYHRVIYNDGDDTQFVIPSLKLTLLFS